MSKIEKKGVYSCKNKAKDEINDELDTIIKYINDAIDIC